VLSAAFDRRLLSLYSINAGRRPLERAAGVGAGNADRRRESSLRAALTLPYEVNAAHDAPNRSSAG